MDTKTCLRCKRDLPVDSFGRARNRKDGRYPYCLECMVTYRAERREKDAVSSRSHYERVGRAREREKRYGITAEEYDALLASQGGVCAICQDPPGREVLCVDHDHETGVIRGLCCRRCNSGLGHLRDDPELLRRALAYLERVTTS